MTPLKTICGVSAPDSRTLLIQPYDMGAMQAIEKAIMKSDLGIMPNNDGKVIRINIPQLTAVRRAFCLAGCEQNRSDLGIRVKMRRRVVSGMCRRLTVCLRYAAVMTPSCMNLCNSCER